MQVCRKKVFPDGMNNSGIFSIEVAWYPLTPAVAMEILQVFHPSPLVLVT
jgi:hypothetical protein